MISDFLN